MRTGLRRAPQVVRIASALNADRLRVVGALHAIWSLADEHTEDGVLEGYTFDLLDEEIGWIGFSEAMGAVKWLGQTEKGLCFPDFTQHNGSSAKRRTQEADRKRVSRASASTSASDADKKRTREEKRREEPKTLPPPADKATRLPVDWTLPAEWRQWCRTARPDLDSDEVAATFADFWHAKPGKDGRKLDWQATWRNWCRNTKRGPAGVVPQTASLEYE